MKARAASSLSERELVQVLKQDGVSVSLAQLGDWRKEGLLPPLSSRGRGAGGGRIYFWNDAGILDQARCVRDLLARHGRHSTAILVLWLCGYPVSSAKARRAWLQRARRPRVWQLRDGALAEAPPAEPAADTFLLQAVLKLCSSFTDSQRAESLEMQELLLRAGTALGLTDTLEEERRHRFFTALGLVLAAIDNSSLIATASESDMEAARLLTESTGRLVLELTAPEHGASPEELARWMETLGAALFLCALLLQRTGYRSHLSQSQGAMRDLMLRLRPGTDRAALLLSFRALLQDIWSTGPQTQRRSGGRPARGAVSRPPA